MFHVPVVTVRVFLMGFYMGMSVDNDLPSYVPLEGKDELKCQQRKIDGPIIEK